MRRAADSNPLWDYAVQRGWEENVHVIPDLDELIRLVWAGKVEIVLASSLKGMARSVPGLVRVLREFVAHKVTLIVPGQGLGLSEAARSQAWPSVDREPRSREAHRARARRYL